MICHQEGTADSDMEGMLEFKFKRYYKTLEWHASDLAELEEITTQ